MPVTKCGPITIEEKLGLFEVLHIVCGALFYFALLSFEIDRDVFLLSAALIYLADWFLRLSVPAQKIFYFRDVKLFGMRFEVNYFIAAAILYFMMYARWELEDSFYSLFGHTAHCSSLPPSLWKLIDLVLRGPDYAWLTDVVVRFSFAMLLGGYGAYIFVH